MSMLSTFFKGALKNELVKFLIKMAKDLLKAQLLEDLMKKFNRSFDTDAELLAYDLGRKDQAQAIYDEARELVDKIF